MLAHLHIIARFSIKVWPEEFTQIKSRQGWGGVGCGGGGIQSE